MSNCCQMQLPFCCSLFRLRYGYLRAGCRVSRPKSALWKPFFHIANRLFNINAVQLTMLCKQAAVSHGLSRLSAAALPAGHTCPPQPHIFACPRRPAPCAPPAPSARAARIAPSCTVPPCTAPRPPHHPAPRAKSPGSVRSRGGVLWGGSAGSRADELAVAHDDGGRLRARGAAIRVEVVQAVVVRIALDEAVADGQDIAA